MRATKDHILQEIRRTAGENGGTPLGMTRFQAETGITPHEWEKHWARFTEAQVEAGFEPTQMQGAYDDDFLLEIVVSAAQSLGRFPTYRDLEVYRRRDPSRPSKTAFLRLGSKDELTGKVISFCQTRGGLKDVIELCEALPRAPRETRADAGTATSAVGVVYLMKSGKYYKVGMTRDLVRRGTEIRLQLPERLTLIHAIETDDPPGVEHYWKRRFGEQRLEGEWFDLSPKDVKSFKAWRKIV